MKNNIYNMLIKLLWLTIIFCTLLKLFGYKEFEVPIISVNVNVWIERIINSTLFVLNGFCFSIILLKRIPKIKEFIVIVLLSYFNYFISYFIPSCLYLLLDLIIFYIIGLLYIKDKWYKIIIEATLIYVIFTVYQVLTMLYKNININFIVEDFITDKVLQIDYYALIVLTILSVIKKGGYIHVRWWKNILDLFSKQRRFKERLQQNQENVQEVENELGYKIFIVMLSITQLVIVGTACYFVNNAILEFVIVFVSFVFMRKVYGQSYHSNSVIRCTTLALLTFLIATRVSLPLWLSTLCNVFIGCLVAYIMHIMYYYIKYTKKGVTLRLGMNKDDLLKLCSEAGLSELNVNRMVLRYVERKSIQEIADIEFVDSYTISQSLYRSRKKIKNI